MKKLLATMLLLVALPLQASATTYYVNSKAYYAKDYKAGTTALTAKRTMAALDAIVLPGDVVRVYPGAYSFPNPDSSGSNPTGGGYITYIGTHPSADPLSDSTYRYQIVFNTEGPAKPYMSVKGIRISKALHFGSNSNRDSVTYCTIDKSLEIYAGDYNVIENNSFDGPRIEIANTSTTSLATAAIGNTVNYNKFWKIGQGVSGNHLIKFGLNPSSGDVPSWCDSLTFRWNRVYGTYETAGDYSPMYWYRTRNVKFSDNRLEWNIATASTARPWLLRFRDSTYANVMHRDTIIAYGPGGADLGWSTSGGGGALLVFGNTVDSCWINTSALGGGSDSWWYDGMNNWTITNNVFAMKGYAMLADILKGANVVDHNTFVGAEGSSVVNFLGRAGQPAWSDTNLTFTNNIVAAWGKTVAPMPGEDGQSFAAAVTYESAVFDSATLMKAQVGLVSNYNLFAHYGQAYARSDRSILIRNGTTYLASAPGDSTAANPSGIAENRWALDTLSVYGSPRFDRGGPDSVRGVAFNPAIGTRSAARGAGSSGSDIGAVAYVSAGLILASPTILTFQSDISDARTFAVYNTGGDSLIVSSATIPAGRFTISPATARLAAGESATFTVTYSSTASGGGGALVTLLSDDPSKPSLTIPLVAIGISGGGVAEP